MREPKEGIFIIISAPSGCGKTTIVERFLKRHPEWVRSVSVTTRPPRPGEKQAHDYFFVSADAFRRMEVHGELLESAKVFDHFYGTPRDFVMDQVHQGGRVVLAIDVQGARQLKKGLDKKAPLLTVFILPPSVKVLRDRLEGRKTESPAEIQRRIEIAQEEIKEAGSYDYTVVNQNLDHTVDEIEGFIEKFEKERRKRSHAVRTA